MKKAPSVKVGCYRYLLSILPCWDWLMPPQKQCKVKGVVISDVQKQFWKADVESIRRDLEAILDVAHSVIRKLFRGRRPVRGATFEVAGELHANIT